jgi:Leucine-rich repeat (LRR) protein
METNLSLDSPVPPEAQVVPSGEQGNIMLTIVLSSSTYNNSNNYGAEFTATAQQLVVDWGDGSEAETYTNIEYDSRISHNYTGSATYTVQIKGEGLTHFGCNGFLNYGQALTSLDVSGCATLEELECSSNQLTSLHVSGCTALKWLECSSNQLAMLDVRGLRALEGLYCSYNQLTVLDVSGCTALEWLGCSGNQLTSLDVNGCTALEELSCGDNQLTVLDVSGCTALQHLYCSYNQLTATALNTMFTALHTHTGESYGRIFIYNNPGADTCNRAIVQSKDWSLLINNY